MSKARKEQRAADLKSFADEVASSMRVAVGAADTTVIKDSEGATAGLRPLVDMTFSGLPTRNYAIYLPSEMKKGLDSWLAPYPKPVIKNHDTYSDPVGRISSVRYVDIWDEAIAAHPELAAYRSELSKSGGGKSALISRIVAACDAFAPLAEKVDYRGVGVTQAIWDINDPDMITKIKDKRILTVSTSFSPGKVYCSQCAREGKLADLRSRSKEADDCDHWRGEVVDGNVVYYIPADFTYEECSTVTTPAAIHAKIQAIDTGADENVSDSVDAAADVILYDDTDTDISSCGFEFYDSKREVALFEDSVTTVERKEDKTLPKTLAKLLRDDTLLSQVHDLIEDKSLIKSAEELVALPDESYLDLTGRRLPAFDAAHLDAVIKLLETVEVDEEGACAALISDANARREAFKETDAVEDDKAADDKVEDAAEEAPVSDEAADAPLPAATISEAQFNDSLNKIALLEDRITELKLVRDALRREKERFEARIGLLNAENSKLTDELEQEKKGRLVDELVAIQKRNGISVDISDDDRRAKLMARSIESLNDSIADFSTVASQDESIPLPAEGLAPAPGAGNEEDAADKSADKNAVSGLKFIIDRYYELRLRSQAHADKYLIEQKRRGFIPASFNVED